VVGEDAPQPRRAAVAGAGASAIATSAWTSVTRRISARSRTRSSARSVGSIAETSRIVRVGLVTGMPRSVVVSSAPRLRVRWTRRWAPRRRLGPRIVTSMDTASEARRSHSAAAEAWLRTASGPHARTAASQRPCAPSTGWPTAYTPRRTRCSRPTRTRRAIAASVRPRARSCPRATTPNWDAATSAIRWSTGRGSTMRGSMQTIVCRRNRVVAAKSHQFCAVFVSLRVAARGGDQGAPGGVATNGRTATTRCHAPPGGGRPRDGVATQVE
jgi:hypothetical protein